MFSYIRGILFANPPPTQVRGRSFSPVDHYNFFQIYNFPNFIFTRTFFFNFPYIHYRILYFDAYVFPLISIRSEDRLQSLKCAPFTLYSTFHADCFKKTMCIIYGMILLNIVSNDKLHWPAGKNKNFHNSSIMYILNRLIIW